MQSYVPVTKSLVTAELKKKKIYYIFFFFFLRCAGKMLKSDKLLDAMHL